MTESQLKQSCSVKCLKYTVICITCIGLIAGLLLAGVAGYEAFDENSSIRSMQNDFNFDILFIGLCILMAVGLLLVLVSIFGISAAIYEKKNFLVGFFTAVVIVFVFLLCGFTLSLVKLKGIESEIVDTLRKPHDSFTSKELILHAIMKKLEKKLHCCGLKGPQDYGVNIPASCSKSTLHRISPRSLSDVITPNSEGYETHSTIVPVSTTESERLQGHLTTTTTNYQITEKEPETYSTSTPGGATEPVHSQNHLTTTTANYQITEKGTDDSNNFISSITTESEYSEGHLTTTTASYQYFQNGTVSMTGPYHRGCEKVLAPFVFAVGGIAIAIIVVGLVLLIFIRFLLSSTKDGYAALSGEDDHE